MLDMFGNLEEQQKALEGKLREILIEETSTDGAIKVTIDATRKVRDIAIDSSKIDVNDIDQLQDLLIATLNKALDTAEVKAAAEAKKQIQDFLPGGLGNLFGE